MYVKKILNFGRNDKNIKFLIVIFAEAEGFGKNWRVEILLCEDILIFTKDFSKMYTLHKERTHEQNYVDADPVV